MPSPSWEDLSVFYTHERDGGFACDAIVIVDGVARPDPIVVIFDDPYLNSDAGQYHLSTSAPTASCPDAVAANIQRGMVLLIKGTHYDVRDVDPNGQGTSTITLDYA